MRRILSAAFGLLFSLTLTLSSVHAIENTWDYSVQVSATVQSSPGKVTLTWPQDTNGVPSSYTLFRRAPGSTNWGNGTQLSGSATSYTDTSVSVGNAYEYRIVKSASTYTGYGYITVGVEAPLVDTHGKLVLVVDNTMAAPLASELSRLEQDLRGDGWTVIRKDVSRTDTPQSVKAVIKSVYDSDPANVKSVFLFGHVPVPYSGQFNPDGHADHIGAWPADVYYADMDGNWTDNSVNYVQTLNTDPVDAKRISNVPGDGKFDQTTIPSTVELELGRVDLANMPGRLTWGGPATFPTETELLRKYLNKDHNFRNRVTSAPRRAILGDYFGIRGGESFAASGFRSFAPLVGVNNVRNLNTEFNDQKGHWVPETAKNDYLLAYGCGAGSYSAMGGLGNSGIYNDAITTEMVQNNVRGVFNLLFGSWLGDWDHEDNFLRSPLVTDSGLASMWSGRPHWFIHPLGTGATLGAITRLTQNNAGQYQTQINSAENRVHIALMGDPSLRLHPVAPINNLNGTGSGSTIALTWSASTDSNLIGYLVYRASSATGAYTRLTNSPIAATNFTDSSGTAGATYMVRAVKMESTPSGTYQNASQGVFWTVGSAATAGETVAAVSNGTNGNNGTNVTSTPTTSSASNTTSTTTSSTSQTSPTSQTSQSTTTTSAATAGNVVWFDDALPLGAGTGTNGDTWNWVTSNPAPQSGSKAHKSDLKSGLHEHSFNWATPLTPTTGDILYTWVYLDPANPPAEIMLSFAVANWEHRAYWGANNIGYGTDKTASRYYMGALPAAGQWVRLEIPAKLLELENQPIVGMGFSAYNGAVTWDSTGLSSATAAATTSPTIASDTTASVTSNPTTTSSSTSTAATSPTTPTTAIATNTVPTSSDLLLTTTSTTTQPVTSAAQSADTVWFDDALPPGAGGGATGGDAWTWVSSSPAPFSGTVAHQSNISSGLHEHFFGWAGKTLKVDAGEKLFVYVYIDPANVPSELMLSWCTDNWEHRAYWGADKIAYGTAGTAGRFYAGTIPAAGQWVRLEVPAKAVALEGATIRGMTFSLFGGRATWDNTGKTTASSATTTAPGTNTSGTTTTVADLIWVDDALPAGAQAFTNADSWNWITSSPAPVAGGKSFQTAAKSGLHEVFFNWASNTMPVATGDVMFAYVYIDPANVPSEIMLNWCSDNWEHRAYWGANKINYGTDKTAGRYYMGAIPSAGGWVRLEVPAKSVNLEGANVQGMCFSLYDGRVAFDKIGKGAPAPIVADNSGNTSGGSTNTSGGTTTTTTPPPTTTTPPSTTTPPTTSTVVDSIWFDDALPAGAGGSGTGGDNWNWVTSNPAPVSGAKAHQTNLASGVHEHSFAWASQTMNVATGDKLFAYVYLDPANPPSEIMLSWGSNNWEHRAYWGSNKIIYGTDKTASRYYVGALPATGQWVRLEVPASAVGLEGQTVSMMGFSLYDGRATFDKTGKFTGTSATTPTTTDTSGAGNVATTPPADTSGGTTTSGGNTTTTPPPVVTTPTDPVVTVPPVDTTVPTTPSIPLVPNADENAMSREPVVGDHRLRILTPTLIELDRVTTKDPDPAVAKDWNFADSNGNFTAPSKTEFQITVGGKTANITSIGYRRRVAYAPLNVRDLRIDNALYLQLDTTIADGATVEVKNASGALWPSSFSYVAKADTLRFSPAIHVNQEGYVPSLAKKAMVGYWLGNLGEMNIDAAQGFKLVSAATGATVFSGTLSLRKETGYVYSPLPYQKVYEADFTSFTTPGEYQLVVPGIGASLPFLINDGVAMLFTRTYAAGLFHQRCGFALNLPFTRFTHDACHVAPAEVPSPQSSYSFTWTTIASKNADAKSNPRHTAPQLKDEASQLYPFVNKGKVDVSGGHHDAGDYSKYTINVAELAHLLTFTADSVGSAGNLDNLGIPESGDGKSDIMQEAKQETDYLAKLQDADGGFYFIVYPKTREYEGDVSPDKGDTQVVWPKNTSATAAAVAALAQAASSPKFKAAYPAEAANYLAKAKLGWQFLTNAIAKYGKDGSYQKVTFYGDNYMHDDELAWAACEMFLATGDQAYHAKLKEWFPNPADTATMRWGWWRMSESWGNAMRSYAFAARSGRLPASALDATYLAACEQQIKLAGDDALAWSNASAYGTAMPVETRHVMGAGWYFSLDQASDMAVAYQLNPKPEYMTALVGNMNYEAGTNPINQTYVTGIGIKRQHEVVNQWANNNRQTLPVTGVPTGNVQAGFDYLWNYGASGNELSKLTFPTDNNNAPNMYPFYDRWADTWNVTTEFITVNQARSLLSAATIASQTNAKGTAWKPSVTATITVPALVPVGEPTTLSLVTSGLDLAGARIVWEARDNEPDFGSTYTITPKNNGAQWAEAEIVWPDGRRVFATASFSANAPVITWVDDAMPSGAYAGGGNESWSWVTSPAKSGTKAHQSGTGAGIHEHSFVEGTPLAVGTGDSLFCWVYIDPANVPEEIMLHWNDGSWDHRAYWGANKIGYGTDGTNSRRSMGALPAAGGWVKLVVPASSVGLEGRNVTGMCFSTYGGRVTWDAAGRAQAGN